MEYHLGQNSDFRPLMQHLMPKLVRKDIELKIKQAGSRYCIRERKSEIFAGIRYQK